MPHKKQMNCSGTVEFSSVRDADGKDAPENITAADSSLYESWICRTGSGDRDAFCRLYERTGRILFSYALSLLHNREDAEDAVHDTFLKIRSAAHLYTPMGKPLAWMLTIERNICLMRLRARNRFADRPPTEDGGPDTIRAGDSRLTSRQRGNTASGTHANRLSAADTPGSFRGTDDIENRILLQKALQTLSKEEASIVLLHASGGMKHREIAEQMKLPLSTVLSKYRRALEKLRRQLKDTVP